MQFKIDTKPTYTIITPLEIPADANLAASLADECRIQTDNGSKNFIIDLIHLGDHKIKNPDDWASLHQYYYEHARSLVFTNVPEVFLNSLQQVEVGDLLHITPTTIEAIDFISMEILERELLGEN